MFKLVLDLFIFKLDLFDPESGSVGIPSAGSLPLFLRISSTTYCLFPVLSCLVSSPHSLHLPCLVSPFSISKHRCPCPSLLSAALPLPAEDDRELESVSPVVGASLCARQEWLTVRQRGPGETPDCQGTSPLETPVSPTHHALDQEPEPSLHLSSENRNPPDDATPGPTHGHSCTLTRCWAAPRDTQALTRLGALVILFPPSPRRGSRGKTSS